MPNKKIKHRGVFSSILISLLSTPAPGIGHIFAGKMARGLIIFSIFLGVLFLSASTGAMHYFTGMIIVYCFLSITFLFLIFDTYFLNRKKSGIQLKSYNRWYLYLFFGLILCALSNIFISSWGYRTFRIVSNSNYPALRQGTLVLAEMDYGLKPGIHIANIQGHAHLIILLHTLDYPIGSLVLIKIPKNQLQDFFDKFLQQHKGISVKDKNRIMETKKNLANFDIIKRIVARGNDVFEIKHGTAYLNGKIISEPYVLAYHNTSPKSLSFGPVIIPKGFFLVLGDNRDDSFDSRDFGIIPKSALQGKILFKIF